jgi:SagB-type dehydrogenase family enzyme
MDPLPAVKPVTTGDVINLCQPDLNALQQNDSPMAEVMERRCSIREYGAEPISIEQLGEFLYRVARVRDRWTDEYVTPHGSVRMEISSRPYPTGGALYALEVYVVVQSCRGLDPGLYHYDPLGHRLGRVSRWTDEVEKLSLSASAAMGPMNCGLQVLLIMAARFQRVTWKYETLAYNVILKDVGVLMQNMYLAATAMDLAPCAIGSGNSDLFSRAIGSDYYAETSVGEFALGSKK